MSCLMNVYRDGGIQDMRGDRIWVGWIIMW